MLMDVATCPGQYPLIWLAQGHANEQGIVLTRVYNFVSVLNRRLHVPVIDEN